MNILVTGANGFIGKNICFKFVENGYNNIIKIHRNTAKEDLIKGLEKADIIFHLAGVNRPKNESEFEQGNAEFTKIITQHLLDLKKNTTIVFCSSTQAEDTNPYGLSKVKAENIIKSYSENTGANYFIYRLPNVFGKWCKPNYNSFIATFCHNLVMDNPIEIHNPNSEVNLVYIDDVCSSFLHLLNAKEDGGYKHIENVYTTTVGVVVDLLYKFKESRKNITTENVGNGLERALYSTFISYLEPNNFTYTIVGHEDERGIFCEFLKTKNSGQIAFFTALPGITRGGHYHHTKSEKFLVLEGIAMFKFQNIVSEEMYEIEINSTELKVIESIPGWAHNITNIGDTNLVVMLWSNEVFDRELPDTIAKII